MRMLVILIEMENYWISLEMDITGWGYLLVRICLLHSTFFELFEHLQIDFIISGALGHSIHVWDGSNGDILFVGGFYMDVTTVNLHTPSQEYRAKYGKVYFVGSMVIVLIVGGKGLWLCG